MTAFIRDASGSLFVAALTATLIFGGVRHLGQAPPVYAQDDRSEPIAVVTTGGVTMKVHPGAWSGEPERFDKVLPVLVEITNDGEVPLRIRHAQFSLLTTSGERVVATPPFNLGVTETDPVGASSDPYIGYPFFGHVFFPYAQGFFPFGSFGRSGHFGGYPYSRLGPFAFFRSVRLPSSDMVAKALPEVVVEPGARATGFVYFVDHGEHVDLDHGSPVDFRADLLNAETREWIATIGVLLIADDDALEIAESREFYVETGAQKVHFSGRSARRPVETVGPVFQAQE